MKIIHLVTRRQYRGAEIFAAQLSKEQIKNGFNVSYISLYAPPEKELSVVATSVLDMCGNSNLTIDLALLIRLVKVISTIRPDIVQANGADTLKYSVLSKLLTSHKFVLLYRNISVASLWIKSPIKKFLYRLLIQNVNGVIAVSNESRKDFMVTYKVPENKIITIPIGAFPSVVSRTEALEKLKQLLTVDILDSKLLVHVGSFSEEKNQIILLSIIELLKQKYKNLILVCFGDGPTREYVMGEAKSRKIKIYFPGSVSNILEFLPAFDLLLMPSLKEGIPAVIIEAAMANVVTVAFNAGSIHEAIVDGETGYLVPVDDITSFVNKIDILLSNSNFRSHMANHSRNLAREKFSLEKIVVQFTEFYKSRLR